MLQLKSIDVKKKRLPKQQWLMIFFDIPEKLRKTRDSFRIIIKQLGFDQLQKSIWITPYDVTNRVKELIENYGISEYAQFMLVNKIGNDIKDIKEK